MSIDEKALDKACTAFCNAKIGNGEIRVGELVKTTIEAYEAAKASGQPDFLKDWSEGGHTKAHLISEQPVRCPATMGFDPPADCQAPDCPCANNRSNGFTDCEKAIVHNGYHKMNSVYQHAFRAGWDARILKRESGCVYCNAQKRRDVLGDPMEGVGPKE